MELIWPLILCICMLLVTYYDLKSYLIPNWVNLKILMLFPVFYFTAPAPELLDPYSALYGFGLCFVIGFSMFAIGMMGGGRLQTLHRARALGWLRRGIGAFCVIYDPHRPVNEHHITDHSREHCKGKT